MTLIPKPKNFGTLHVESFAEYRKKWPEIYGNIPDAVIETWIYRHWAQFQFWLPLQPLSWVYEFRKMPSEEILKISHVGDWAETLEYWGNDLIDGCSRKETWLGKYFLEHGTSPAPIIIAEHAGHIRHPRESGRPFMCEPYQIVEGHMRLAYLQAMIKRKFGKIQNFHDVFVVNIPL